MPEMRRLFWPAFSLLALLAGARQARANGAFPDSLQILLPADRPDEIGLATNFGLILSEDHGQTWQWVCEGAALRSASLYQVGPPPLDRLYAVSSVGVVTSDDRACTWQRAGGQVDRVIATDVFAGPASAERVLAIASPFDGMTIGPPGIYSSMDGGVTFDEVLYRAAADDVLMGVEVAASAPDVIYAALYSSPGVHPKLLRTHDGGMSWETIDLEPMIGSAYVRIVAVDREDPRRIFLRVQGSPNEELAVSDDGGDTFRRPVKVTGQLGGFATLPSGTIVVGGISAGATAAGVGFRSRDGGQTFQPWPKAPRVRALAAREGVLYIAADNFSDGYALATSADEGDTITPIMKYADVSGAKSCVQAGCDPSCAYEASIQVWARTVCVDAGAAPAGPKTPAAGCGCALDDGSPPGTFGLWLISVLIAGGRAKRAPRSTGGCRLVAVTGRLRVCFVLAAWLAPAAVALDLTSCNDGSTGCCMICAECACGNACVSCATKCALPRGCACGSNTALSRGELTVEQRASVSPDGGESGGVQNGNVVTR